MDKKSKEALRRYKKARQAQTSSSESSSDDSGSSSSSYSSDAERKERRRKKKARLAAAAAAASRRSSSSSGDERKKREKRRNQIKRKLKEAKLRKKAADAAAALSGNSHRPLSPSTQAKIKKLAERKHQRAASKERREREREKLRAAARERERERHRGTSRSPTKITKIRIHQDVKQRQKSPQRMHHQLMAREKIIIQTRTRERTPSAERERQHRENKIRHEEMIRERDRRDRDRERAEREAARDKERAEALARCQERQRERERIAREKIRREEEDKKYSSREREHGLSSGRVYSSRERSIDVMSKRDIDVYDREREFMEAERRGLIDRDEYRREREYIAARRRDLSPVVDHYGARMRDPRDLYGEEEREMAYSRAYMEDARHARDRDAWIDPREMRERDMHDAREIRDFREMDHNRIYPDERGDRTRGSDWNVPRERDWDEMGRSTSGFIGTSKRTTNSNMPTSSSKGQRTTSEANWDVDEIKSASNNATSANKSDSGALREESGQRYGVTTAQRDPWMEHDQRDVHPPSGREKLPPIGPGDRRWGQDWREGDELLSRAGPSGLMPMHHHRSARGFRRGGPGVIDHVDRNAAIGPGSSPYSRNLPPPLMQLPVPPPPPVGNYHGSPRFPSKRSMTYTNPNIIKKQQAAMAAAKAAAQASAATAVAAAKAAAQSVANSTTNPAIIGQGIVIAHSHAALSTNEDIGATTENPEAGEIINDDERKDIETTGHFTNSPAMAMDSEAKANAELSEISDSDDDILTKTEKKNSFSNDDTIEETTSGENNPIAVEDKAQTEEPLIATSTEANTATDTINNGQEDISTAPLEDRLEEDEMLDFEEISDGELEEDARNKVGVGDALGVDWASLIAETKRHAAMDTAGHDSEHPTTAKQKWQPHRIILDIGISMKMAGEEYAKGLIRSAQEKLDNELKEIHLKSEISKEKVAPSIETDSQTDLNVNADVDVKKPINVDSNKINGSDINTQNETKSWLDWLHPLACMQVSQRAHNLEKRKLIDNVCGPNSRALSARQDLKLRRQLCGLPKQELHMTHPLPIVSNKLKAKAMAAFQRTLEIKA